LTTKNTIADQFWNAAASVPKDSNEAAVEHLLVQPLLSALGFDPADIGAKVPVALKEGSKRGRPFEADFVAYSGALHDRDTSLLVVEAKVPGASLDEARKQGESYAMALRAPAILLTDGVVIQVWQIQVTLESTLMCECPVDQLKAYRGNLEQLIGKQALILHAASLAHKKLSATTDLGPYELAELERTKKINQAIDRTLSLDSGERVGSERLLEKYTQGAVITAPSGFGKTTLAAAVLRLAIKHRWENTASAVPIDMPLVDLQASGVSPLEFAFARITPHIPQMTHAAMEDLARRHGLLLVCDGFDRLGQEARPAVVSQLRQFARDYPKSNLFVFSRGSGVPELSLPRLQLQPLSDKEQHLMATSISGDYFPLAGMPRLLTDLSVVPLLLERIVAFWVANERFPSRLEQLFEHWVAQLLDGAAVPASAAQTVICDIVLEQLAHEMGMRPLTPSAALRSTEACGGDRATFDALIGCGILRMTKTSVEFVHEGVADYFRVRSLLALPFSQLQSVLSSFIMDEDSLLPVLLVAQVKDAASREYIWQRLQEMSLSRYIDAIRFSEDSGEVFTQSNMGQAVHIFTEQMSHSIATLIDVYFQPVAGELRGCLANSLDPVDALTLTAAITPLPDAYLTYSLQPSATNSATVGPLPAGGRHHGINLNSYRLGIHDGRYLGTIVVYEGLSALIQSRRFRGGALLANERSIGRLRFMKEEFDFQVDPEEPIADLLQRLGPSAHMFVPSSSSGRVCFTISGLIQDLELLRENGKRCLDWWWLQYGTPAELADNQEMIEALLRDHYQRAMALYVEIVTTSFTRVSMQFSPFRLLPLRWELVLVSSGFAQMPSQHWRWMPVGRDDEARIDITFADQVPDDFLDMHEHSERLSAALTNLGRSTNRYSIGGFTPFPEVGPYDWRGRLTGETSVMRHVVNYLKEDVNALFHDLPNHGPAIGDFSLD